jgi:hypothetical protein
LPLLKTVEDGGFFNCSKIKSINLPNAENIEKYGFSNCVGLV